MTLLSSKTGVYENAKQDVEMSVTNFNQCLQDVGLKISIGEIDFILHVD
jgi:hypothetical protein